jgi:hypothetical protein
VDMYDYFCEQGRLEKLMVTISIAPAFFHRRQSRRSMSRKANTGISIPEYVLEPGTLGVLV